MPRTLKLAGIQIALVAMILRALLPLGWMPDTEGSSGAPFVICTMNGPMHPANRHQPGHDDVRQTDVCPFAASIHVATPVTAAAIVPSLRVAVSALAGLPPRAIQAVARHAPQSPRAPPSLV